MERRGSKIRNIEDVDQALAEMFDSEAMSKKLKDTASNDDGSAISAYYSSKRENESEVDAKSLSTVFSI